MVRVWKVYEGHLVPILKREAIYAEVNPKSVAVVVSIVRIGRRNDSF